MLKRLTTREELLAAPGIWHDGKVWSHDQVDAYIQVVKDAEFLLRGAYRIPTLDEFKTISAALEADQPAPDGDAIIAAIKAAPVLPSHQVMPAGTVIAYMRQYNEHDLTESVPGDPEGTPWHIIKLPEKDGVGKLLDGLLELDEFIELTRDELAAILDEEGLTIVRKADQ